jgi:hypothetical protein
MCLCGSLPLCGHFCGAVDAVTRLIQVLMIVLFGGYFIKIVEYAASHGGHEHALDALTTSSFWLIDFGHIVRGVAVAIVLTAACMLLRMCHPRYKLPYLERASLNV